MYFIEKSLVESYAERLINEDGIWKMARRLVKSDLSEPVKFPALPDGKWQIN